MVCRHAMQSPLTAGTSPEESVRMADANFTLIDAGRVLPIAATVDTAHVRLSSAALRDALGWELKPQGLCKGERCIPVSEPPDLVTGNGIDLNGLAALLGRPLALDAEAGAACL